MTKRELKEYTAAIREVRQEVAVSPSTSRELLVKAGIVTPKGNLRKPYR